MRRPRGRGIRPSPHPGPARSPAPLPVPDTVVPLVSTPALAMESPLASPTPALDILYVHDNQEIKAAMSVIQLDDTSMTNITFEDIRVERGRAAW